MLRANLTAPDPIWTRAIVTQMHRYHVHDTLYAVDLLNPAGLMSIMRLNHLQAPFDDPKTRQAVALAVDQAEYMRPTPGSDRSGWGVRPA